MKSWAIALLAVVALEGCGVIMPLTRSTSKVANAKLGDSREDTIRKLGRPNLVRAAKLEEGHSFQIDEYSLYPKRQSAENLVMGIVFFTIPWWVEPHKPQPYWFYYEEGELKHVAPAEEFQRVEEFRMRFSELMPDANRRRRVEGMGR